MVQPFAGLMADDLVRKLRSSMRSPDTSRESGP